MNFRKSIIRLGLETFYYSGLYRIFKPACSGKGIIFTLHRVQPLSESGFNPNGLLEITPDFLEAVVLHVRAAGFDLVSLDEARLRLQQPDARKFVCLTFDDGYLDNLELAYPILKKHDVPFCIYACSGLINRATEPWWIVLEEIIRQQDIVALDTGSETLSFRTVTDAEKTIAYQALWQCLMTGNQHWQRQMIRQLADTYSFDIADLNDELFMTWEQIRQMNDDPLVTFGAHTVNHYAIGLLDADEAREEMAEGARELERQLNETPRHFSYPYGMAMAAGPRDFSIARDLGFETAVTTVPGLLNADHQENMMSLPRISLNGEFQNLRYLDVFMSGAPTTFYKALKQIKGERLKAA